MSEFQQPQCFSFLKVYVGFIDDDETGFVLRNHHFEIFEAGCSFDVRTGADVADDPSVIFVVSSFSGFEEGVRLSGGESKRGMR